VHVALRATNLTLLDSLPASPSDPLGAARPHLGYRVEVPPADRVEVRFPVAADMAGASRFQAVVSAGDHADAVLGAFPVWTPATSEAFATYGELDEGAADAAHQLGLCMRRQLIVHAAQGAPLRRQGVVDLHEPVHQPLLGKLRAAEHPREEAAAGRQGMREGREFAVGLGDERIIT